MRARNANDGRTLTVRVPLTLRKRGGRKQVILPEGASWSVPRARIDNTMVKAIARAHRWRRLLESGQFTSVTELSAAEKINDSYLARVLLLTLLAPDIVEAILDGRQPANMTLSVLLRPFAVEWRGRRHEAHSVNDMAGRFATALPGYGFAAPVKKAS